MYKLSICIPSFNRAEELKNCLNSIPTLDEVEVVIVDDGSNDDTKQTVAHFDNLQIVYHYQANQGRAAALKKAIELSHGEFIVIMDSDDWFINNGVSKILSTLAENDSQYECFIFGASWSRADNEGVNRVPDKLLTNFIKLRADYRVQGDLKEVVKAGVIKSVLYSYPSKIRRVPTSLLWARIAQLYDCYCLDITIAHKTYLIGGLSSNISQIKIENSQPLRDLYVLLYKSKKYQSLKFRMRSYFLYNYYNVSIKQTKFVRNPFAVLLWFAARLIIK